MLEAVEDHHRLTVGFLKQLLQLVQFGVVDRLPAVILQVNSAIGKLRQLARQNTCIGRQKRIVAVHELQKLLTLKSPIRGHYGRRQLNFARQIDPVWQLQPVRSRHTHAHVADLVIDLLLGASDRNVVIDDIAVTPAWDKVPLLISPHRFA